MINHAKQDITTTTKSERDKVRAALLRRGAWPDYMTQNEVGFFIRYRYREAGIYHYRTVFIGTRRFNSASVKTLARYFKASTRG